MKRTRRAAALAGTMTVLLAAAVSGGTAHAQDNVGAAPPPPGGPTMVQDAPADAPSQVPGTAPASDAAPTSGTGAPGASSGGSGNGGPRGAGARNKGTGQLSGFSYGTHDSPEVQAVLAGHHSNGGGAVPRPPHSHKSARATTGSVATYPGFSMRDDGGSRVFVQLTRAVPVEEHKAAGQITYLLKGAHVTERNNENALVTVHFNTPVSRARLRPVGHDLALTIELRGAATPTYKVEGGTDGGSRLVVDFPEGQFLDNDGEPLGAPKEQVYLDGASPTGRSASRTGSGGGSRRGSGSGGGGGRHGGGGGHPTAPSSSGMSDTTDSTP